MDCLNPMYVRAGFYGGRLVGSIPSAHCLDINVLRIQNAYRSSLDNEDPSPRTKLEVW